ncbi:hypothetical protein FRB91_000603 [Serendipita sp. 411]|nr:hypothetical protein FRB91_000603 [Serendipita sp. 411]
MHLIVPRACPEGSVTCPSNQVVECNPLCGENQQCIVSSRTCTQCATATCVDNPRSSGSNKPNTGAIAGGVIAALLVVALGLGYIWYRRRKQAAAAAATMRRRTVEVKPDIVASADTVLNRPDPVEKRPVPSIYENDIRMEQLNPPENPFSDHASIATASDRSTNVIPIGLITPSSSSVGKSDITSTHTATTPASITSAFSAQQEASSPYRSKPIGPLRPQRGPEIDLRLDPSRPTSNTSSLLLPPNVPYAASARSGVSSRASTISTGSSFLNEAPQIVTPKQANFRQVLGVQRAEVVKLNSNPSSPAASIKSHLSTSTLGKQLRSPLSQQAYDATDAQGVLDQGDSHNPFADYKGDGASTFETDALSTRDVLSPMEWTGNGRPESSMSHAESIVNISSAQRVQLVRPVAEARALLAPSSPSSATPRVVDFRTAGQLSPPAQAIPRSFDDGMNHRMSGASLALTNRTSTTDSILEAFPFVPPSPISMHHSQPNTPTQRSFQGQQQTASRVTILKEPPHRPGRMTLGMSTMSSVSTSSSGLESYSFQVEDRGSPQEGVVVANADMHRDIRASLDTIQVSRDVAQYPLPDSPPTPKLPRPVGGQPAP